MEDIISLVISVLMLALCIGIIAGVWKVFSKAGKPGWACLIPIYNVIVLLQIIGRPWWWLVLLLVPIVGIIVAVMVSIELAKSFGKGAGFGIGLALLGPIFFPILGFGNDRYLGAKQSG
jgi:hypothetical protein